jgi:hypothetical protein
MPCVRISWNLEPPIKGSSPFFLPQKSPKGSSPRAPDSIHHYILPTWSQNRQKNAAQKRLQKNLEKNPVQKYSNPKLFLFRLKWAKIKVPMTVLVYDSRPPHFSAEARLFFASRCPSSLKIAKHFPFTNLALNIFSSPCLLHRKVLTLSDDLKSTDSQKLKSQLEIHLRCFCCQTSQYFPWSKIREHLVPTRCRVTWKATFLHYKRR